MGTLPGYKYRQEIPIISDGTERSNWPIHLQVFKGSPTYEYNASGWSVGGRTLRWRIPFIVRTYTDVEAGYQIYVPIDTATLCADTRNGSGGSRFFGGTTASYAKTPEFTDHEGNVLGFWCESAYGQPANFNTVTTHYWIRAKTALTTGTKYVFYIYLDYANSGASSYYGGRYNPSTGAGVFDFFEDFDTSWSGSNQAERLSNFLSAYPDWECPGGTPDPTYVSPSQLTITATTLYSVLRVKAASLSANNFGFMCYVNAVTYRGGTRYLWGMYDGSYNNAWVITPIASGTSAVELNFRVNGVDNQINQDFPATPFLLELDHNSGKCLAFYNRILQRLPNDTTGIYYKSGFNQSSTDYRPTFLWVYNGADANAYIRMDWVAVRKQCLQAPLVGTTATANPQVRAPYKDCDGCHIQFPPLFLEQCGASDGSKFGRIFLNNRYNAPDIVLGTDGKDYVCTADHISDSSNRPITGGNWSSYWKLSDTEGAGEQWQSGRTYVAGVDLQPDDIVFTAADGTTQLYRYFLPITMAQQGGYACDCIVRVPSIPASGGTSIYCYYGGPACSSEYRSGDNVCVKSDGTKLAFDDFDTTNPETWNEISGSWAKVVQARGIYLDELNRWARGPYVYYANGNWHLFACSAGSLPGNRTTNWCNPYVVNHAVGRDPLHFTHVETLWWDYSDFCYGSGGILNNPCWGDALWYDSDTGTYYLSMDYVNEYRVFSFTDIENISLSRTNIRFTYADDPELNPANGDFLITCYFMKRSGKWMVLYTLRNEGTTKNRRIRYAYSDTGAPGTWSTPVTIHSLTGNESYLEHPVPVYDPDSGRWFMFFDRALNNDTDWSTMGHDSIADNDFGPGMTEANWTKHGAVNFQVYEVNKQQSPMVGISPSKIDGKWYLWSGCVSEQEWGNLGQDNPLLFATCTSLSANQWQTRDGDTHYEYKQQTVDSNTYTTLLSGKTFGDCEILCEFGTGAADIDVEGAGQARILFRYNDANNYFYLHVWRVNATAEGFVVYVVTNGSAAPLGAANIDSGAIVESDISHGKMYLARIRLYGDNIKAHVSIDGGRRWIQVCDYTYAQTGGQIGFQSYSGTALFSSFCVLQYSGTAPYPSYPSPEETLRAFGSSGGNMVAEAFLAGILR